MAKQFNSPDAFAREVAEFQRKLEREYRRELSFRAAARGQRIAREAAAADLGGDPKFSGWKPRLATVVKPKQDGTSWLLPTKTSAGPWTVAEIGRNADGGVGLFQGPAVNLRSGRATRDRQGNLKVFNRRARRGRRWNGRTEGKSTGSDALAQMEREIPDDVAEQFKRQLQRHFDVR